MKFAGTTVLRLENGRIAEELGQEDALSAMLQLGLICPPELELAQARRAVRCRADGIIWQRLRKLGAETSLSHPSTLDPAGINSDPQSRLLAGFRYPAMSIVWSLAGG
jgi:hypothetical protein